MPALSAELRAPLPLPAKDQSGGPPARQELAARVLLKRKRDQAYNQRTGFAAQKARGKRTNYKDQRNWHARNPWAKYLIWARQRCNNPKISEWHRYGGRGILCLMTLQNVKEIWDRDQAANLKCASIDRYPNNDGHYEPGNIRFIEKSKNVSAPKWFALAGQ